MLNARKQKLNNHVKSSTFSFNNQVTELGKRVGANLSRSIYIYIYNIQL